MTKSRKSHFLMINFLFVFMLIVVGCGNLNNSSSSSQTPTTSFVDSQSSEQPNTNFKYQIYLLALESGYEGTYEDWLASIRGSDGKDGEDGINGSEVELIVEDGMIMWKYSHEDETSWRILISLNELAGTDGKDGENGVDGKDGEDGSNGRDGLDGSDGRDGVDGSDGQDGKDGLTPYIGENGNWFIGDEDTGIASVRTIENMDRVGTDGLYFDLTIRNGIAGYEVVGYSGTDLDIIIPNQIFGQKVLSIKQGALPTSISSLSISKYTETLPNFQSYSKLRNFDFNNAPISVLPSNAFRDAVNLKSIANYTNIHTIGAYSFHNTQILINEFDFSNITAIGDYAFYLNSNANFGIEFVIVYIEGSEYRVADETFIYLPETVNSIGVRAFPDEFSVYYGGNSEVSFSSPLLFKNVKKTIDDYWYVDHNTYVGLLNYTGELKEITVPSKLDEKNVTIVENYAFIGDNHLTRINLPSSITSIGMYSFSYTRQLYVLHVPSSIVNISGTLFASWIGYDFEELSSIFPAALVVFENEQANMVLANNSVESYAWGRFAFGYTSSQILQDEDFVYLEKTFTMEILAIKNASGKVTIPSTYQSKPISRINQFSLNGDNGGVTVVEISNGVEFISSLAFNESEALRYVSLPLSINAVNYLGFYGLSNAEIHVAASQKPSNWDSTWFNDVRSVVWNSQLKDTLLSKDGMFLYSTSQNNAKIIKYLGGWSSSFPLIIPSVIDDFDVTAIATGAITYTSSSTTLSIVIPDSVSSIENEAILYYRNLVVYSEHLLRPAGWVTTFAKSSYYNNLTDSYRTYYWSGSWSLINNVPAAN